MAISIDISTFTPKPVATERFVEISSDVAVGTYGFPNYYSCMEHQFSLAGITNGLTFDPGIVINATSGAATGLKIIDYAWRQSSNPTTQGTSPSLAATTGIFTFYVSAGTHTGYLTIWVA